MGRDWVIEIATPGLSQLPRRAGETPKSRSENHTTRPITRRKTGKMGGKGNKKIRGEEEGDRTARAFLTSPGPVC